MTKWPHRSFLGSCKADGNCSPIMSPGLQAAHACTRFCPPWRVVLALYDLFVSHFTTEPYLNNNKHSMVSAFRLIIQMDLTQKRKKEWGGKRKTGHGGPVVERYKLPGVESGCGFKSWRETKPRRAAFSGEVIHDLAYILFLFLIIVFGIGSCSGGTPKQGVVRL